MEFGGEVKALGVTSCVARDVPRSIIEKTCEAMASVLERAGVAQPTVSYVFEDTLPHDNITRIHTHIFAIGDALTTDAPSRDAHELEIEQMYGSMYDLREFAK